VQSFYSISTVKYNVLFGLLKSGLDLDLKFLASASSIWPCLTGLLITAPDLTLILSLIPNPKQNRNEPILILTLTLNAPELGTVSVKTKKCAVINCSQKVKMAFPPSCSIYNWQPQAPVLVL